MTKLTPKQKAMLDVAVKDSRGRVQLWDRHDAKVANWLELKKLGKVEYRNFQKHFIVNDAGREAAKS